MTPPVLQAKLDALPDRPGVYLFRNGEGGLVYVGKAKSLRSRVRSYFQPSARHTPRIEQMVCEVADLEIVVVDTEVEALILEASLIKRERPRYNVFLRDDKSFPYLRLSARDPYPRLSLVRRARLDGNLYFGPYVPAWVAHRTLKLVPRFFRVATCSEIFDGQRRPCLYYHLDQCLAPCAGKTNPEEYGRAVRDVRLFLEGKHGELEGSLESQMRRASDTLEYEKAARFRDTLRTVRKVAVRQRMASVGLEDQDYLAHHREGEQIAVELFQVRQGKVQGRREFTFADMGLDLGAFYAAVLSQYYSESPPPSEIYLAHEPAGLHVLEEWLRKRRGRRIRIRVPVRGGKKRLIDLVEKNARLAFESRFRAPHSHGVRVLEALAEAIGLEEPPYRIECFDISNIQGADPVASLVVWEGGKPRRSDYRTYTIRGVTGPDDFASMAEVVTRRYSRLLREHRRLPDLVLLDGGAGQLGTAVRALAVVGIPMLPVIALSKRQEEIHLQGEGDPVRLDRSSPALHLLQRIRDEAHRFAVTHHRKRRARRTLRTKLLEVPGVGPATARKLLREFGSVERVRAADRERLTRVAGRRVAENIARWVGDRAREK